MGKIKKGFKKERISQDPLCAIKILADKDEKTRVKRGKNEARYHALLGREVLLSVRNNKSYVFIPPWFDGMNMHDYAKHLKQYAQDYFYTLPFKKPETYTLLRMFRHYLKQARIFHNLGLILQDPKSSNAMVVNGTIELFDFDAVHPIGTQENTHTRAYLPPDLIDKSSREIGRFYTQADDIYIFGLMLAEIFPEVFNIIHTERKPTEIKVITQRPSFYQDLEDLVLQMTHTDRQQRPSIDACLASIEVLLKIHTPKGIPEMKGKDELDMLSEKVEERKKQVLLDALCLSITNNESKKTEVILNAYPEFLNQICGDSKQQTTTPFTLALEYKRVEIVEFAFRHALKTADYKQVDRILKSDFSKELLNKKLMQERSPLAIARELKENGDGDRQKIIDALLENGAELEDDADLSLYSEQFLTKLLYQALQSGEVEKIKKIVEANKRIVNNQLPNGLLPLATVLNDKKISKEVQYEIIILLLKSGAGIVKDYGSKEIIKAPWDLFKKVLHKKFWKALRSGDKDITILLDYFPELIETWHVGENHKSSVLMMAAYYNQKEIVQYLINKKVDVFVVNLKGETAEDILRNGKQKNIEIIEILKDAAFRQALDNQDYKRFSQTFEQQKAKGVNATLEDGSTPLTRLLNCKNITAGGEQIMRELLQHEVDLFSSDANGKFPLKMVMEHKGVDSLVKAHLQTVASVLGIDIDRFFTETDIYKILEDKFSAKKKEISDKLNYYQKQLLVSKEADFETGEASDLLKTLKKFEYDSKEATLQSTHILKSCDKLSQIDNELQKIIAEKVEPFFSRKKEQCVATLKHITTHINDTILKYQSGLDEKPGLPESKKAKEELNVANALRENLKFLENNIGKQDFGKLIGLLNSEYFSGKKLYEELSKIIDRCEILSKLEILIDSKVLPLLGSLDQSSFEERIQRVQRFKQGCENYDPAIANMFFTQEKLDHPIKLVLDSRLPGIERVISLMLKIPEKHNIIARSFVAINKIGPAQYAEFSQYVKESKTYEPEVGTVLSLLHDNGYLSHGDENIFSFVLNLPVEKLRNIHKNYFYVKQMKEFLDSPDIKAMIGDSAKNRLKMHEFLLSNFSEFKDIRAIFAKEPVKNPHGFMEFMFRKGHPPVSEIGDMIKRHNQLQTLKLSSESARKNFMAVESKTLDEIFRILKPYRWEFNSLILDKILDKIPGEVRKICKQEIESHGDLTVILFRKIYSHMVDCSSDLTKKNLSTLNALMESKDAELFATMDKIIIESESGIKVWEFTKKYSSVSESRIFHNLLVNSVIPLMSCRWPFAHNIRLLNEILERGLTKTEFASDVKAVDKFCTARINESCTQTILKFKKVFQALDIGSRRKGPGLSEFFPTLTGKLQFTLEDFKVVETFVSNESNPPIVKMAWETARKYIDNFDNNMNMFKAIYTWGYHNNQTLFKTGNPNKEFTAESVQAATSGRTRDIYMALNL
jgi:serine/threonine protein kinase